MGGREPCPCGRPQVLPWAPGPGRQKQLRTGIGQEGQTRATGDRHWARGTEIRGTNPRAGKDVVAGEDDKKGTPQPQETLEMSMKAEKVPLKLFSQDRGSRLGLKTGGGPAPAKPSGPGRNLHAEPYWGWPQRGQGLRLPRGSPVAV